jgi:hypothetical protein
METPNPILCIGKTRDNLLIYRIIGCFPLSIRNCNILEFDMAGELPECCVTILPDPFDDLGYGDPGFFEA